MPSVADVFASIGLDVTQLNLNAQAAKVKIIEMAEGMALPINDVGKLLAAVTAQIGKMGAQEGMKQLAAQSYDAAQAARLLLTAINELADAERNRVNAAKQAGAAIEAQAQQQISLQRDMIARQKEMFDRDKAGHAEALRVEKDLSAQRQQIQRDAEQRQQEMFDRDRSAQIEVMRLEKERADAAKANAAAITQAQNDQVVAMRQTAQAMGDIGRIGAIAFAPIVVGAGIALNSFKEFDHALQTSVAILTDQVTPAIRDELANAAREMAKVSKFSAVEAAEAFRFLGTSGLSAAEAIKALPVVANFATAANISLEKATTLLTQSQTALGLRIRDDATANMQNMVHVADLLVAADQRVAGSAQQFAEALTNKAAAALSLVNKTAEEGVSVLAALAEKGIVGAKAGDFLYRALRDLETKAVSNKKAFEELGISVFDTNGKMRPLADILKNMEDHFNGLSDRATRADLNMLKFGERSASVLQILLKTGDRVKDLQGQLSDVGGTSQRVADTQLLSFENRLLLLQHRANDVMITFGQPLSEAILGMAATSETAFKAAEGLTSSFNALDKSTKQFIVGGVAVIGVLGEMGSASLIVGSMALRAAADIQALGGATAVFNTLLGGAGAAGLVGLIGVGLVGALVAATVQWTEYKNGLQTAFDKSQEFYKLYNAQHPTAPGAPGAKNAPGVTTFVPEPAFTAVDGKKVAGDYDMIKVSIEGVTKATKDELALDDTIRQSEAERKAAAAAAKKSLNEREAAYREMTKGIQAATNEHNKLNQALTLFGVKAAEPTTADYILKMQMISIAYQKGEISLVQFNAALDGFHKKMGELDQSTLTSLAQDASILFDKVEKISKADLAKNLMAGADVAKAYVKSITDAVINTSQLTADQSKAFTRMGIKSQQDLNSYAAEAVKDYNLIVNSGKASADGIERAWVKMEEARIDAGEHFTTLQLISIALVSKTSETASKKVYDMAREITRTIDQLARKMATDLVEGLAKAFDSSGNDKLSQQIEGLNRDLADHAAAWRQAQSDAVNAIDKINSDLQSGLADELAAYTQFVNDVNAKFEQIVTNHRDAQRRIQEDAAASLRDQTISYQRFVEDTNEKIREAQAKGDEAAVADLQKQLRRRTEDYNNYVNDLNKATQRKLQDDAAAQAKETADLQKQLADRAALHDKTDADLQAKAAEQVKQVQANLAEQQAAYEKFVADTTAQITALEAQFTSAASRIGDAFRNMFENFAKDFGKAIATIAIDGLFKDLEKKVADKLKSLVGLGGSAVKNAPPVNLPDEVANLPGGATKLPSGTAPASGGGSSAGTSILGGSVLGAINLGVDIAAGITQGIQMSRLINLTGEIEVTTRKIQNEIVNLRNDSWERETHLMLKLDDMWNEIRTVVEVLRIAIVTGGGVTDSADFTTGTGESINDLLTKAINDKPALYEGAFIVPAQDMTVALQNLNQAVTRSNEVIAANTNAVNYGTAALDTLKALPVDYNKTSVPGFTGYDAQPVFGPAGAGPQFGGADTGIDVGPVAGFPGSIGRDRKSGQIIYPAGQSAETPGNAPQGTQSGASTFQPHSNVFDYNKAFAQGSPNWLTKPDYAPAGYITGSGSGGDSKMVTLIVPNPDSDKVAEGLIQAVGDRGYHLI